MLKLLFGLVAWPLHWGREGKGDMAFMRLLLVLHGPVIAGGAFGMWWTAAGGYLWMCVGFLLIWAAQPSRPELAAAPA